MRLPLTLSRSTGTPTTSTTRPGRTLDVAHRGASVVAPENTLAAFLFHHDFFDYYEIEGGTVYAAARFTPLVQVSAGYRTDAYRSLSRNPSPGSSVVPSTGTPRKAWIDGFAGVTAMLLKVTAPSLSPIMVSMP